MAALSVIGYKPVDSMLHRLDPRTKQIMVMVQSTACFVGDIFFLGLISVCILSCLITSRIELLSILREIRYFLVFLCFVFAIRTVTLSDNFVPVFALSQVQSAAIFCWRLLLVVLMGVLLISTTRTGEIRAALVWTLRPLPFVNERAAATMVGLIVRMVPVILFQAGEIGDAMRSRCIEYRKNPLFRINRFTIMLFRRAITSADDLVDTMQARCYQEDRTMRELYFSRRDYLVLVVGAALLSTLFID
jgi:biotin transport system permease protein/energy-coupling factor transport system permease protein